MSARGLLLVVVTVVAIGVAGESFVAGAASGGAPSLLGEWHMDTIQSGEVPETPSTVNSADGLQIYGAQQVAGRFGKAFSFNGADRDSLRAEGGDFQPSQITVMAWVKASSSPGSYKAIIAKGGDTDCGVASYALYTGSNGGASFYIATNGTTTVNSASIAPAKIWNGQWHALVGTYDGSAVRLYLDGTLVGSATASGGAAIDYAVDESALSVGDFEPCSGFSFTGGIDEVRVYDGALSDAEVAEVSSSTATTPPELTGTTTTTTTTGTASTTTSTATTTTTTTSGSTPPPPLPAASLNTLPSPIKGGSPLLSAAGTTGATQLLYDINGDHKSDIALSPSLPYTQLILPKGGNTTVTLNAVGSLQQQTSTASTTIKLAATAPQFRSSLPQIAVSSSSTAAFERISPAQFLQAPCVPTEVDFGIIGAYGCLKHVTTPSEVPASEADTADLYIDDDSQCLGYIQIWPDACDGLNVPFSVYVASSSIKLNGMTMAPNNGAAIVIDPVDKVVYSSDATLKLGPFVIKQGAVVLDFTDHVGDPSGGTPNDLTYTGSTGTVLSFDASKDVPLIGGFPLDAGAELAFTADNGVRESVATLHVMLPQTFDAFGSGDQPSGSVSVAATNTSGFSLDTLDLTVPHASIAGIGLDNLGFHYAAGGDMAPNILCPRDYWHATGDIELGESSGGQPAGILMTPPPDQNGVSFCAGSLKGIGAQLTFGCPLLCPPELFPGVFLDDINFAVGLGPTLIRGGATISAAELTKISGTLLAVFASPENTYTLTASDAGTDLQDLVGRRFSSTSFAIGGAISLQVPGVGDLNIAHGGAVYSYPDYIGLGAKVDTQLGIFVFHGSLGAQFAIDRGLFEADASAEICVRGFTIFGVPLCGGGLLVASEKGVVACVNVFGLNPGIGVKTNGTLDVWLPDGCKPSQYWSAGRGSFMANALYPHAAQAVRITVAKGESSKSVKLVGSGGAPHVEITGPGGQMLSIDGDGAAKQGALQAISESTYSTTWIGLKDARPGTYTITPLPDSVPIASMAETRPSYDSDFSASVSGRGSRLTLHYDARKRGGGQRVTFFEDGANVTHELVTSTGGTGTVRFTPAPGAAGTRTIVARATVDGSPIRSQTLAHFHFAGTVKTGRPGKVTVQRKGGSLLVKWTAAAGATRYGVLLTRSDGAQQRFTVSASHRSLRVGHFPLTFGGRVSVSARGVLGDWGAARKSKSFKATKRAKSVLVTKKIHKPARKKR